MTPEAVQKANRLIETLRQLRSNHAQIQKAARLTVTTEENEPNRLGELFKDRSATLKLQAGSEAFEKIRSLLISTVASEITSIEDELRSLGVEL